MVAETALMTISAQTTSLEPGTSVLELSGIVHRYGRSFVLRGANLSLARGEVLALYGANGAGKTTLLKIISGAQSPTRGGVRVFGLEARDRAQVRARTLLVSHSLGLYPELNGMENLEFAARMHLRNLPKSRFETVLERVGLAGVKTRVRGYSSGMRKRLALAKMLLLEPDLVLLDEPFAALDPSGKALVSELLTLERARGATLIVSSHEPELTSKIATLETTLEAGLLSIPIAPKLGVQV
jgi:heme exporter protein A